MALFGLLEPLIKAGIGPQIGRARSWNTGRHGVGAVACSVFDESEYRGGMERARDGWESITSAIAATDEHAEAGVLGSGLAGGAAWMATLKAGMGSGSIRATEGCLVAVQLLDIIHYLM